MWMKRTEGRTFNKRSTTALSSNWHRNAASKSCRSGRDFFFSTATFVFDWVVRSEPLNARQHIVNLKCVRAGRAPNERNNKS